MTPRAHLAALLFALVFALGPALANADAGCGSCCCASAPCDDDARPCATPEDTRCCDAAPEAAPQVAKRSFEKPSLTALLPTRAVAFDAAPRAGRYLRAGDLAARVSPLRRSVVLRL